jgi:UDP-N-acetylglucosamine 2-epimerase (non-hydrolysing)
VRILHVVGARPNYMKIAPLIRALTGGESGVEPLLVHTGQHYDDDMSGRFFADLELPEPDAYLGIGSGSHATQTAAVLVGIEKLLLERRPDLLVVAGDVNSTLAAALAASKLGIPVAHVEAGLRSSDWTMPEECNRVLTDRLSDLLFTHSPEAAEHLAREGIDARRVHAVGNLMVDSLDAMLPAARAAGARARFALEPGSYAIVTLHRPANVDDPARLRGFVDALCEVSDLLPLVFPVHPRTRAVLEGAALWARLAERPGVRLSGPLGYLDFLSLLADARLAATDSGGIQEETTVLGVPCLTLRDNTERPVTVTLGTNRLLGTDPRRLAPAVRGVLSAAPPGARRPPGWDGRAAERAAEVIRAWWSARTAPPS